MKTKFLFSALCLGLLASCSNEELMEQQNPVADQNGTINVVVGAGFGTNASTRQAYNDDLNDWQYYWTNADVLGACRGDDDDNILTNTWFSNDVAEGELMKEATFKTSAALATGKYIFYAPYREDMLEGKISTALPEVQVQEGTSRKHLMDNNLFLTAMLDLKNDEGAEFKKDAEVELPLTFKSIYHTLDMQIGIESSTPSAITVEKIVVTPETATGTVLQTKNDAYLDFSAIEAASGSNDGLVEIDAAAIADAETLQGDVADALEAIMEASAIEAGGADADNSYTLMLKDGYTYSSATDKCRAYMLIPATTTAKFLKVEVYTNQGVYTEEIALDGKTGITAVAMERNAVTHITKSLTIRYDLNNSNVEQLSNFTINNEDDWDYACTYVREHFAQFGSTTNWTNPTFTLAKDVEVSSYPTDFRFTLAANSAVKLTVAKDFNLTNTKLSGTNVTFVVKEGTTLTFDSEVASAGTNLKIENYGTIVNNIAPTTQSPSLNLTFASLINGENTKNGKTGVINNNGVISVPANGLTNNLKGTINNAAGAVLKASAANAITNNSAINLQGEDSELEVTGAAGVKNEGTITLEADAAITDGGSGTITQVTTSGKIVVKDINKYEIEPTTLTNQIVSVEVASLADFKKAVDADEMTDVTVTAAITTDDAVDAATKTVTLKGNLTLGNAQFDVKTLIVEGDVTLATASNTVAPVVKGSLTVNSGKLTVNKEVTLNENAVANVAVATILGEMSVSGKAYFATATVGKSMAPATQVSNGVLTVEDEDGAVFAAKSAIDNWGTITQSGKGKIGPSVNNEHTTSTFHGNADSGTNVPNA